MKTKELTQTDKLKLILEKLVIYCQAVETSKSIEHFWEHNHKKRSYTVVFNSFNLSNISAMKIPFPEFYVMATEDFIMIKEIANDNIELPKLNIEIAPNQLLTIYNRFKKIITISIYVCQYRTGS
jgi:hypothetical protein